MTNRRHPGIGSDGTLDRLNDALSALENRIAGASRGPESEPDRFGLDDVASIREREAALRARPAPAPAQMVNSRQADFAALREKLQATRPSSTPSGSAVNELRADIESLKGAVAQLARQDSLVELADRWGVVEREIARMPETLASREDMAGMAARLESISQALAAMPQTLETRALEDRLQTLASAMEAFGEQQAGLERSLVGGLDDRFSAIDRAIENLNRFDAGIDRDALDRIEARIVGLNRQMEDMQSGAAQDYAPMFDDMLRRLEGLQSTSNDDPAVHDALTMIAERVADLQVASAPGSVASEAEMHALTERLDHIVDMLQTSHHSAPALGEHPAVGDIEARLEALTQQLSQSAETTGRSVEQAVVGLENRIDELGKMLHGRDADPATAQPLDNVEERLDDIARFLAQTAHSTPSASAASTIDTEALEVQIAELSARLSETTNTIATAAPIVADAGAPVDVMEAARSAAEQVLNQANLSGTGTADIERLSDDLKSLETLARESDGRHERTFEAIHDTLLKIVDHLSDLEHRHADHAGVSTRPQPVSGQQPEDFQSPDYPEPPSAIQPAIPSQAGLHESPLTGRLPLDDAPPIESDGRSPRAQELTPAQAAASAAIAAMAKSDGAAPAKVDVVPEKKSILQAVTNRFTRSDVAGESSDAGAPGDMPLEPDTAQAEVAEIIARVRREREGGDTSPTPDVSMDPGAVTRTAPTNSKSDFIAAARRAAQAAASDAQAAESRVVSKSSGLKSTVANVLANKRRPILIGAAAILLAILALPLVRGLMGGDNQLAVTPPTPPTIEQQAQPALDNEPAEVEQLTSVDPQEGAVVPRIINTDPAAVDQQSQSPVDVMIQPDFETDAPLEEIAVEEVLAETEPVVVSAIPTDAGTPAMQDAARAGDPIAMFLVGDYHAAQAQTDQDANVDAVNAEALMWYTRSAEAGYAPAQQRLGSLYEKGIGTERDLQSAKSWYQLAADQGNSAAMHNLGVLHANGVDGQPNLTEAVSWFEKSALFGVPDSQYNLGVMAFRGDGMDANVRDSYKWFALAAQTGDPDAATKRDAVAERMDPETLELAKDEVALWRPRQLDLAANIVAVPDAWQTDQMRTAATPSDQPVDMQKAVENIQAILNANGYNAGPVDGLMGDQTRQAISTFQADNGLAPTGEVNEELVRKLLALAG